MALASETLTSFATAYAGDGERSGGRETFGRCLRPPKLSRVSLRLTRAMESGAEVVRPTGDGSGLRNSHEFRYGRVGQAKLAGEIAAGGTIPFSYPTHSPSVAPPRHG